ncbi:hypothetical protein SELR_18560 [Selenomonas ruminantium subsp. lactilytica TAM6421]|uniref:Putative Flp pilus-assembly TadG-like N-terminal domain-containing protein n=1 Tax=Selenomonas ruminantium subsp. lactilytica (strain NBRC 103574 / TAM6421) TaxID=927704 RepID=I0GS27_SELRL|nr:Tad domain-containing protein [Selenomonas ruminantium]BAL83564.1 hypothetical protein SELR_18560 [Selenomonas ruminantium subsp. lactilytica TAM6421]
MKVKSFLGQKGAVLILTAFVLPMIIAIAGLAVDFGNVYLHKAVLQNCADSSALGGAKYGVRTGSFKKNDADTEANILLEKNRKYDLESKDYQYTASRKYPESKHYYIVTLQENVPMFFLRYFGFKNIDIKASAKVLIKSDGQKNAFSYLFCYRDDLYVVNTVPSNDPYIIKNFNGDIAYTNDVIPIKQYDTTLYKAHLSNGWSQDENSGIRHLYKTKGRKDVNDDKTDDISDPVFKENLKLHVDSLDAKILEEYKKSTNGLSRNLTSKDLDNVTSIRCYESTDLTIDRQIWGNVDEPIYIYVQESDVFHLNVYADSRRPVIICQIKNPNNQWSRGGKMHVVGKNGVTFRGILYIPDCNELNINEENMNFKGSIVSPSIRTQGKGSYEYESFIKNSGSGSNSSVAVSPEVSLVDEAD